MLSTENSGKKKEKRFYINQLEKGVGRVYITSTTDDIAYLNLAPTAATCLF